TVTLQDVQFPSGSSLPSVGSWSRASRVDTCGDFLRITYGRQEESLPYPMDAAKRREISRKGGQMAHMKGTAHEFTSTEARAAGRKGGGAVSRDRAHMAEIGRKGGLHRRKRPPS